MFSAGDDNDEDDPYANMGDVSKMLKREKSGKKKKEKLERDEALKKKREELEVSSATHAVSDTFLKRSNNIHRPRRGGRA